ncbi:hypothetical protein ACRALDRAFT_2054777 [Sodiomyces alcalophilus JCM 7366]|uniref:uncharacterized protein n=1 Tax=Sodiomyces alcalophilus JCM 7366 TaxID=591952 RepID=UPI0039B51373
MACLQKMPVITKPEHDVYENIYPTNPSSQRSPPEPWVSEAIPDLVGLFSLSDLLPPLETAFSQQQFENQWPPCARDTDLETPPGVSDDVDNSYRSPHHSHAVTAHDVPVPNAWKCCRCGAAKWTSPTTYPFRPSPFPPVQETEKCAGVVLGSSSNQRNPSENTAHQCGDNGPTTGYTKDEARECGHLQCSACQVGTFARARRVLTTVLFGVEGECWEGVALETGWELDFVRWK